jgi:hypothetical protein
MGIRGAGLRAYLNARRPYGTKSPFSRKSGSNHLVILGNVSPTGHWRSLSERASSTASNSSSDIPGSQRATRRRSSDTPGAQGKDPS